MRRPRALPPGGVLGEPAEHERGEEQQPRVDRGRVVVRRDERCPHLTVANTVHGTVHVTPKGTGLGTATYLDSACRWPYPTLLPVRSRPPQRECGRSATSACSRASSVPSTPRWACSGPSSS